VVGHCLCHELSKRRLQKVSVRPFERLHQESVATGDQQHAHGLAASGDRRARLQSGDASHRSGVDLGLLSLLAARASPWHRSLHARWRRHPWPLLRGVPRRPSTIASVLEVPGLARTIAWTSRCRRSMRDGVSEREYLRVLYLRVWGESVCGGFSFLFPGAL